MAFKAPSDTPQALRADWEKGVFHPVNLLAGPDTVEKEEAAALFQKIYLAGDDSGLGVDRFDGGTAKAEDILNAASTMAFFGGRRVVLVRRAHELSSQDSNRLADGMSRIPDGNAVILLWEGRLDPRNVLLQAVKSRGRVVTFWPPFENQLPAWVQARAKSAGKAMSLAAARSLVASCGADLADLAQEIEKLCLYTGKNPEITEEDVESSSGASRSVQYLELDRAIWRRDLKKALEIWEIQRSRGDAPEMLLAALARIYRKIMTAKALLAENKMSREEVLRDMMRLKLREPQAEFASALGACGWDDLLSAMKKVMLAEIDLKTGRLPPTVAVTLLLRDLLGK